MTIRLRVTLTLVVVMGMSCATRAGPPGGAPVVEQRYEANGTVLDDGGGPELCLGGIAESLPPQCGGIQIHDWSWDVVEGEQTAGGVTWGDFHVVGIYDGATFRVEQAGPPRWVPEEGDPFATPCPEPAGGWTSSGPATTDDDRIAAMHIAEDLPAYAGIWIDYLEEPVEFEVPGPVILNIAFTGEPERYESAIREAWDGPLCLIEFEHTYRELRQAQNRLSDGGAEDVDLEVLWSSVDVMTNTVELGVVVSTATAESALIEAYGPGMIEVIPALRPV